MIPGTATAPGEPSSEARPGPEIHAEAAPAGASQESSAADLGDYEARLRHEPEFAVSEFKKLRREMDRQYSRYVKPIKHVADTLPGGTRSIGELLVQYNSLMSHPEMAGVAREFLRTGQVRAGGASSSVAGVGGSSDGDYIDPDQTIRELENRIASLEDRLQRTSAQTYGAALNQHLDTLRQQNPDVFDDLILPGVEAAFDDLKATPQGRAVLENLNFDTVKTLAGKVMYDKMSEIGKRRYEQELSKMKASSTGSGPPSAPPARRPEDQQIFKSTREAFAAYRQLRGIPR